MKHEQRHLGKRLKSKKKPNANIFIQTFKKERKKYS